tara:strand:+ start:1278 stop:2111 length:834 start_codon:yes stop_codon:yes gene_type:complete
MTLILSSSNLNLDGVDTQTPWHTDGITTEDYEMAQECGLITPRNDKRLEQEIEFNKMIDYDVEFERQGDEFIQEFEHAWDGSSYNCEYPDYSKTFEYIDVRVVMKKENFAIGTIDGDNNVYIPAGLMNILTIGEIVQMNIVYHPQGKNTWKAIYTHPKYSPIIVDQFISLTENNQCDHLSQTFDIPKQNIGKMIGKNGICIQKVLNDIVYRNKKAKEVFTMKEDNKNVDMTQDTVPKYDVNNFDDFTQVKVWDIPSSRNKSMKDFNQIKEIFMKLYC